MASQQNLSNCNDPNMQLMNDTTSSVSHNPYSSFVASTSLGVLSISTSSMLCSILTVVPKTMTKKYEGAYQINYLPCGFVPNQCSSNHDSDALNGIPQYMEISSLYIDVTFFLFSFSLLGLFLTWKFFFSSGSTISSS